MTPTAFWKNVDRNAASVTSVGTPCWVWRGSVGSKGYGFVWDGEKMRLAHRHAWTLRRGAIPAGMQVMHRCDTRACVRLAHLTLGTQADNEQDKKKKGRAFFHRGETTYNAKLNDQVVRKIRKDSRYQRDIAQEYGIHQSQVCRIKSGAAWAHVGEN